MQRLATWNSVAKRVSRILHHLFISSTINKRAEEPCILALLRKLNYLSDTRKVESLKSEVPKCAIDRYSVNSKHVFSTVIRQKYSIFDWVSKTQS